MTNIDAFRDDEDVDTTSTAEKEPTLFYGSADEFVRGRLRYMYARRVGPGNASFRWAARWWDYPRSSRPRRCSVARLGTPTPGPRDWLKYLVD